MVNGTKRSRGVPIFLCTTTPLLLFLTVLVQRLVGVWPTSNALAIFSYAGQEHRKTFLAPIRVFEFEKLEKKRIKIEQQYKQGGTGLGSAVWDGAFVLGEYLQREEPDVLKNKCVVEIGAGLGLVSIVASHMKAAQVIATDGDVNLFPMIQKNMEANGVSAVLAAANNGTATGQRNSSTQVLPLHWGNETEIQQVKESCTGGQVDVLLAADVVFEHDPEKQTKDDLHKSGLTFDSLVSTFTSLSNPDTTLFLAYKHRYRRENSFFKKVKEHFTLNAVSRAKIHRDFLSSKIKIYKMKRTNAKRHSENKKMINKEEDEL
jgi:predicted nicotinamide N-methyase|eukprot:g703.t1